MTDQAQEYIRRQPGDMITAEDWNGLQAKIRADITGQIETAKQEIKKSGVERADNADKFDNKTPKHWTDELDQRYAPKVHDHEGMAGYRRYFKHMQANQSVVLEHNLGRMPLVDVYELLPVGPQLEPAINDKFYLYYHHEERDRDALFTRDRATKRWAWGTPIEQVLQEHQVQWEDDDSLGDVVNDLLDAFFNTPNTDEMDHRTSPWINDHRGDLIRDLKQRDEWPDIRWMFRPFKVVVGYELFEQNQGALSAIDITHLSYNTLALTTPGSLGMQRIPPGRNRDGGDGAFGDNREFVDLMILLRS
jgi:hypothetical protein